MIENSRKLIFPPHSKARKKMKKVNQSFFLIFDILLPFNVPIGFLTEFQSQIAFSESDNNFDRNAPLVGIRSKTKKKIISSRPRFENIGPYDVRIERHPGMSSIKIHISYI
jgi:hypothetical protein